MEEVRLAIESSKSSGSYASSAHVDNPCNPGLVIDGYGAVGLPLSIRDAAELLQYFGSSKGSTIESDATSNAFSSSNHPKCLNFSSDKISFDNPAWQSFISGLFDAARRDLGILCHSSLILRSLSLLGHEQELQHGQHEQKQNSAEKDKVYGSFMVTLPSSHEGAIVSLTRKKQTYTFESAGAGTYGATWAAWYSDTLCDTSAVTSGFRLALIYDMVQTDNGPRPSALVAEDDVQQLIDALTLWTSKVITNPRILVHCLENSGETAGLGLDKLQAEDEAQVRCLESACAIADVVLYLADLEWQTQERGEETYEESDDLEEDHLQFTTLTDVHGNLIAEDMEIVPSYLLQTDLYSEDRVPDEEEEEDVPYWDYEGALAITRRYHDKVAVLVPKTSRISFLTRHYFYTNCRDLIAELAKDLHQKILKDDTDQNIRDELAQLANLVVADRAKSTKHHVQSWSGVPSKKQDDDLFAIIEALMACGNYSLLKRVIGELELEELGYKGTDASMSRLCTKLPAIDLQTIKEGLFKALKGHEKRRRYHRAGPLGILFDNVKRLKETSQILSSEKVLELHELCVEFVTELLACTDSSIHAQRDVLAEIISFFGSEMLQNSVLPHLIKEGTTSATRIAFIHCLQKQSDMTAHIDVVCNPVLKSILESALEPTQVGGDLVTWIEGALYLDAEHASSTLESMIRGLSTESGDAIACAYFNHIERFLAFIAKDPWPAVRALSSDFIFRILRGHILSELSVHQEYHKDWSHPELQCNCKQCGLINKYLRNAHVQSESFHMYAKERKHVEVECSQIRLSFEVVRGSPMGLRMTKVRKGAQRRCDKWIANRARIIQEISQWSQGRDLDIILGPRYQSIVEVDVRELATPSTDNSSRTMPALPGVDKSTVLAPITGNAYQPANSSALKRPNDENLEPARKNEDGRGAFPKQRVQVIDLT